MSKSLIFEDLGHGNILCTINLDALYPDQKQMNTFNARWTDFLDSDEGHSLVLSRSDNIITYPHKSWLPEKQTDKPSLLLLFGNPAPHSVLKDIYFAYEGKGTEHRFWKVLRELGFTDLYGSDPNIKTKFLGLNHQSPFRLGFEVIYSFPSSASKPKWSGVLGVERLFGKKAAVSLIELEKERLKQCIVQFLNGRGTIIALQKDAYNAISQDQYDLNLAVNGNLRSFYNEVPIYGAPPTRWLYTAKMKTLLLEIKADILNS